MLNPNKYIYIEKWGRMLGSYRYYIENQQLLAAQENAPINAIYRQSKNDWKTTDDISNNDTRRRLGLPSNVESTK